MIVTDHSGAPCMLALQLPVKLHPAPYHSKPWSLALRIQQEQGHPKGVGMRIVQLTLTERKIRVTYASFAAQSNGKVCTHTRLLEYR